MNKPLNFLSQSFQIIFGIFLASVGLKAFLLPNGFLDGGVTGISILLSEIYGWDISITLMIISIPFLLLAYLRISKNLAIRSVPAILALAISIHYEYFDPITDDKLLIAIFGGLFLGAGIGITIRNGAVLDGSEILGIYLHDKFGLTIGKVITVFNVILFAATTAFLSPEIAMYSVLTYLVTAKVVDFFIKGFEDYVGMMIVSEKNHIIEKYLTKKLGTGLTVYKGSRGYGSRGVQMESEIIHTVINRIDMRKANSMIQKVDPNAFIIEFDVHDIRGGVLRKYLSVTKQKQLSGLPES